MFQDKRFVTDELVTSTEFETCYLGHASISSPAFGSICNSVFYYEISELTSPPFAIVVKMAPHHLSSL